MLWIAPASIPESLALTRQRAPATKPMPQMTPAPGTLRAGSASSSKWPAIVESSSHGLPGSSSRATRSRGSNWPRRSNNGAARAEASRVRASSARNSATSASMPARCVA